MTNRVPISPRALLARINRANPRVRVCKSRGIARASLGEYYAVGLASGKVIAHHIDLDSYGERKGVLKAHEVVDWSGGW